MTTQPYTFLGLTNELLLSLNEVELTAADFNDAIGFHSHSKESINYAIADIIEEEDHAWPWLLNTETQVVTVGIQEYSLNPNSSNISWNSFYIQKDASLEYPDHKELSFIDFQIWRDTYRECDYNSTINEYAKPDYVTRSADNTKYIISPVPDAAYTIVYDYYAIQPELESATDTPLVPERFKAQILSKAKVYAYMFRDNVEESNLQDKRADKKINRMRRNQIAQQEHMIVPF